MQSDENTPAQYSVVNGIDFCTYLFKYVAGENAKEFAADFFFSRNAQFSIIDNVKERASSVFPFEFGSDELGK